MIVTIIPKDFLGQVWPDVVGYIEDAWNTSPGYYSATDILERILNNMEVLWGVYDQNKNLLGCFTTSVEQYPQSRIMIITALAGHDLEKWYDKALETVKRYARDMQCSRIEARGRGGWTAYAKRTGWQVAATVYKIELE